MCGAPQLYVIKGLPWHVPLGGRNKVELLHTYVLLHPRVHWQPESTSVMLRDRAIGTDLHITHERWGSRSNPSLHGQFHYPTDIDRTLNKKRVCETFIFEGSSGNWPFFYIFRSSTCVIQPVLMREYIIHDQHILFTREYVWYTSYTLFTSVIWGHMNTHRYNNIRVYIMYMS